MLRLSTKTFWVATAGTAVSTILLLLVISDMVLALSVLAPVISSWPLSAMLATGIAFSIIALWSGKSVESRRVRWLGYVLNGSALAICIFTISTIGVLVGRSVEERFIIPTGFQGNVYVIHNVKNGSPEDRNFWGYTYRIPIDGILATQTPTSRWTRSKYYYVSPNGKLARIANFWPTTIPDTAENRANTRDKGVYFPRSGSFGNPNLCQFDEFYVGTKSGVLTDFKEADLDGYIRKHGIECGPTR